MGYSTSFKGELLFTRELTASELVKVKAFFGEDARDHPEWGKCNFYYVALEFNDSFTGIQWNGQEKAGGMTEQVNLIVRELRKTVPDFGMTGQLSAQGEDADDRWTLKMVRPDLAETVKVLINGVKVRCPHCERHFIYEG